MGRLERYEDDVATIRAAGTSAQGWVNVTRDGDGELDVRIRPGMLRMLTDNEIAAEIRSALLATLADHHEQYRQLRIAYFGSPVGVRAFAPPAATTTTGQI